MGTTDTAGGVAELAVVADVLGTGVTAAGADVADVEEAMLKHKQRWSEPCDKAGDAVGIAKMTSACVVLCCYVLYVPRSAGARSRACALTRQNLVARRACDVSRVNFV